MGWETRSSSLAHLSSVQFGAPSRAQLLDINFTPPSLDPAGRSRVPSWPSARDLARADRSRRLRIWKHRRSRGGARRRRRLELVTFTELPQSSPSAPSSHFRDGTSAKATGSEGRRGGDVERRAREPVHSASSTPRPSDLPKTGRGRGARCHRLDFLYPEHDLIVELEAANGTPSNSASKAIAPG